MDFYKILKPIAFSLPPETAHNAAIFALKNGLLPIFGKNKIYKSTQIKLWDIDFNNPVGLAAGFDKNADAINNLYSQGFGFVEVGTVTPRPQTGNAKPRLFRLKEDEAIINRFGFNNKGMDYFLNNLQKRKAGTIVGANIGKNKDSEDSVSDYVTLLNKIYGFSDYITINISSPNTPGLRDLQNKEQLGDFLAKILSSSAKLHEEHGKKIPILLKLAPDTNEEQRKDIAGLLKIYKIDGLIISNTTIGERDKLKSKYSNEAGGLSGRPLFQDSTLMVKQMYKLTGGDIPIIGVGGICSGDDAYEKIRAGASLVQVYSALIYEGFSLVGKINDRLAELLKRDGFEHILEAVGADVR